MTRKRTESGDSEGEFVDPSGGVRCGSSHLITDGTGQRTGSNSGSPDTEETADERPLAPVVPIRPASLPAGAGGAGRLTARLSLGDDEELRGGFLEAVRRAAARRRAEKAAEDQRLKDGEQPPPDDDLQ